MMTDSVDSMSLSEIASEFAIEDAKSNASHLRKSRLAFAARRHFADTDAWFSWMQESTRHSYRSCFRYLRVGTLLDALLPRVAVKARVESLPFARIDILAALSVEKIEAFLDNHDVATMDRSVLSAMVQGKPATRLSKANAKKSFPRLDYEQLKLPLGDEASLKRVDQHEEYNIGDVFFTRSINKAVLVKDTVLLKHASAYFVKRWNSVNEQLRILNVPEREIPGMKCTPSR